MVQTLKFSEKTQWNAYRKVRRLLSEGYLVERDGDRLEFPVLQVTKKGFELIQSGLGELSEMRFAAQSVEHDYWATVFQLGEFLCGSMTGVEFFTEQEYQCRDENLLPDWVPKSKSHIPDGLTRIQNGNQHSVFAIEVEIHLKPPLRYDKAGYYFDSGLSNVDIVFWLCRDEKLGKDIIARLNNARLRNIDIHHVIFMDDFKNMGWLAPAKSGQYLGKSVREIYLARCPQDPHQHLIIDSSAELAEVFFPTKKSPAKPRRSVKTPA